jgi:hypothetical protein
MALCDTVQLFGVITETEAYVYGEEGAKEIDSANPAHWAKALQLLGLRDTAYHMLMLSTRLEKVHRPLPEAYVVPFKRRIELTKAILQNRIAYLREPDPYRAKSCAVVGAAPTMKGRGLGSWIDSHDLVWRCNQHVANRSDPDQVGKGQRARFAKAWGRQGGLCQRADVCEACAQHAGPGHRGAHGRRSVAVGQPRQ